MKIKQLKKLIDVKDNQIVRINDDRNNKVFETFMSWDFEPYASEYEGYCKEEIDAVLSLTVSSIEFSKYVLEIWAY